MKLRLYFKYNVDLAIGDNITSMEKRASMALEHVARNWPGPGLKSPATQTLTLTLIQV